MAAYSTLNIADGVTAVDCQKQVRSWQLLRSLIELLIPTCNCAFTEEEDHEVHSHTKQQQHARLYSSKHIFFSSSSSSSSITGTIFGYRRGKVNFCIQTNSKSTSPILLLELAVPTAILAREMRGGVLRIALESTNTPAKNASNYSRSVLSSSAWTMFFNGRRVGYALKRRPSTADTEILRQLNSVVEGAGIISGKEVVDDELKLMYLRAKFDRVCGSPDSESFHLRDPNGSIGQELSIFFFRSI